MTDEPRDREDDGLFPIEPEVPRMARVRNAISGGPANFAADRKVAESIAKATSNGVEGLQAVLEALHRFKMRAVRTVAQECGVRQFLHLGTGTPSTSIVHEHVLSLVPDGRIVYASWDTTTLAHVHALWKDTPEGAVVAHVHGRFDDPRRILDGAAETLDFTRPVAALLPGSLNVLTDEVAQRLVDALRAALCPGSYVVMAQTSLDIFAEGVAEVVAVLDSVLDEPYVLRGKDQIAHHLDGYDLLEPGLVPIEHWRSDGDPPFLTGGQLIPLFGAVGRHR